MAKNTRYFVSGKDKWLTSSPIEDSPANASRIERLLSAGWREIDEKKYQEINVSKQTRGRMPARTVRTGAQEPRAMPQRTKASQAEKVEDKEPSTAVPASKSDEVGKSEVVTTDASAARATLRADRKATGKRLGGLTVEQLKEEVYAAGLKHDSKADKGDLIKLLLDHHEAKAKAQGE